MNIQANSSAKPRVNWLSFPIVGWKGDAAAASQTSARGLDMVQLGCDRVSARGCGREGGLGGLHVYAR
jgi:hypothetical protein